MNWKNGSKPLSDSQCKICNNIIKKLRGAYLNVKSVGKKIFRVLYWLKI